MSQFGYLLGFASLILALAVSDLAISLNRLMAAGAKVRWDWLTPLAALVAFLKIVTQWWGWFSTAPVAETITFDVFLCVLLATVLLFLMAAAALPDSIDEGGIDLREYYGRVSRRFWLLFAANSIVATAAAVWIESTLPHAHIFMALLALPFVPFAVLLAFMRNRLLHTLCLLGFIALYLGRSFGQTLSHPELLMARQEPPNEVASRAVSSACTVPAPDISQRAPLTVAQVAAIIHEAAAAGAHASVVQP